ASAEMEILRSRLVVSQAVDELQLYLSATPDYWPLIGGWLAKRSSGLSSPGLFGWGGYVSGREAIKLGRLEVPAELEGRTLPLVVTDNGFMLQDPDGDILV